MSLLHRIAHKPIIAALRNPELVQDAIHSQVDNIFFMGGTVFDIQPAVHAAKAAGKGTFVHLDLIRGLSNTDKESVQFIAECVMADGIVTPKSHLIREARKHGLYAVFHLFVLDTLAMNNGLKMVESIEPDAIELMPGVIPKVISTFADRFDSIPVIGSGLIHTKDEAELCLQAGATTLSVSEPKLWQLTFDQLNNE